MLISVHCGACSDFGYILPVHDGQPIVYMCSGNLQTLIFLTPCAVEGERKVLDGLPAFLLSLSNVAFRESSTLRSGE